MIISFSFLASLSHFTMAPAKRHFPCEEDESSTHQKKAKQVALEQLLSPSPAVLNSADCNLGIHFFLSFSVSLSSSKFKTLPLICINIIYLFNL